MAVNFPGPYQLELSYVVGGITHKQSLNCQLTSNPTPGDAIGSLNLVTRNSTPAVLSTAMANYVSLIQPMFHTSVQINDATLWYVTPLTNQRTFINTLLIDVAGTSATATTIAGQEYWTFRTVAGGIMKLSLLESNVVPGASIARAALTSYRDAYADFVESEANWIYARDNSYPIVGLGYHPGQNEAVFKRRYRNL